MAILFVLLWFAGGVPLAILSEVVKADSPRLVRVARIAFALLLAGDLVLAALFFSVGNSNPDSHLHATRGIWWVTIVLGGIPLALVSGFAVRRGFTGHRVVLAVATLITAGLYLAFPFGFIAAGKPLTGLGRWEHDHYALDLVILFVPCLILLANELRGGWKPVPEPG